VIAAGDDAARMVADAHLVAEAALADDTSASLRADRDWVTIIRTEGATGADDTVASARSTLFDAWQKADHSDDLKAALQNRAQATGAGEDDQRLWLAWQDAYASPDDATATVESSLVRYPNGPLWLSREADAQTEEATHQHDNDIGMARREELFSEAESNLDKAIAADPREPFYAMQKTLIAVRRSTAAGIVVDAVSASANHRSAVAALEELGVEWPRDPDAEVCAALGFAALGGSDEMAQARTLASQALQSAPGDGNRHVLISAARQSLAFNARAARDPDSAAHQFKLLLLGAQDSGEEAGLANSYLGLLEATGGSAPATAQLLTTLAGEPWSYSVSRALLESLSDEIAAQPDLEVATMGELRTMTSPAAQLAAVTLAASAFKKANADVRVAGAPATADAALDGATRDYHAVYPELATLAQGNDRLIAGRAAALRAESLTGADAQDALRVALATEPQDAALQLSLIDALIEANKVDEARARCDLAAQVLPPTPENLRRLASAASRLADDSTAYRLSEAAYQLAASDPNTDTETFQRVAFTAARAAFTTGQVARAEEIYKGLAAPPWDNVDRAAALSDEYAGWAALGRQDRMRDIQQQITDLNLSKDDADSVTAFLASLEE